MKLLSKSKPKNTSQKDSQVNTFGGKSSLFQNTAVKLVFIAVFGSIGTALLFRAFASTTNYGIEAEDGAITGGAVVATDSNASGGNYIRFGPEISADSLVVSANNDAAPFKETIKGIALANWTFTKGWGKPFVGDVQGLPQALNAIEPGIIRYAGGLWANSVGFDRNRTQVTAYTAWSKNGNTYYFNYGTDELASLDEFAKSINADIMIQVNVSNNDPQMWADLVRYAQEQGWTSFKYYEFGNELDLETANGSGNAISPSEYGSRVAAYQEAMLAVDSSIKLVGGVPATATDNIRNNWSCCGNQVSAYITESLSAARSAGQDLGSVSYHWYQQSGTDTTVDDVMFWSWNIPDSSGEWWRNSYSRHWSGLVNQWIQDSSLSDYSSVDTGISELGVNSSDYVTLNGNHASAVWYSDVLGRLAYSGVDWITQWDSYANVDEYFSLIYPSSDFSTSPQIHLRPSYYAYLMYNKYFGDQMVETSTYDPSKISIWASKDSSDPNKLKLRITNLTNQPIAAPIVLKGFSGTSAEAYVLSSTNPTDTSAASTKSSAPTTINGYSVDGSDVEGSFQNIQPNDVQISGSTFTYTMPAYSSAAIIVNGS